MRSSAVFAGVLFSLFTSILPAHALDAGLERLNRRLEFKGRVAEATTPVSMTLDFTTTERGIVYYRGSMSNGGSPFFWESEVFGRISKKTNGAMKLEILRTEGDLLMTYELTAAGELGELKIRKVKLGEERKIDILTYWYDNSPLEAVSDAGVKLDLKGSPYARRVVDRVLSPVRISGAMDFSPCDGCEHGDQLMIEGELKVNVVDLGFGSFYEADCGGKVHPWLEKLMELKVPFTFDGQITSLSSDYWEGGFWTALAGKGTVYLGTSSKLEIVKFLDRLKALDAEGKFSLAADGKLVFKYAGGELRVDLATGQVRTVAN